MHPGGLLPDQRLGDGAAAAARLVFLMPGEPLLEGRAPRKRVALMPRRVPDARNRPKVIAGSLQEITFNTSTSQRR
jgi:hypothetical protein